MNRSRITWDELWMSFAHVISKRSKCSLAQVGAIIVTADNRMVASCYNGPPRHMQVTGDCSGWCPRAMSASADPAARHSADYSSCMSLHAEANALMMADWNLMQQGTIYVSSAICVNCARLVANSGLARMVHSVTAADAHRDPDRSEEMLRSMMIRTERMT